MSDDVTKSLERARDFLVAIPGATEKATARALTRAATESREVAIQAITDRYNVKPSDIRSKVTTTPASVDVLQSKVLARSGALALSYFPHTPVAIGTGGPGRPALRAEILRGQERSVPGAFIAPINGKPRVMIRSGNSIRSVYTVPMASMLGAESVREAVDAKAGEVVERVLNTEIDKALGGGR